MIYYRIKECPEGLSLCEDRYDSRFTRKTESVFTQCNGLFGVRASQDFRTLEDSRGLFVRGLYGKAPGDVAELVCCPDVTACALTLDGQRVSPDLCPVGAYVRSLNLWTGELTSDIQYRLAGGPVLHVCSRRFASYPVRNLFVQTMTLTLEGPAGMAAELEFGIDGQLTNSGVSHFFQVACRLWDERCMEYRSRLAEGGLRILMTASADSPEQELSCGLRPRGIAERCRFPLHVRQPFTLTRLVLVDPDPAEDPAPQLSLLRRLEQEGYAALLAQQALDMRAFRSEAAVTIEGSSPEERAGLDFAVYHLRGMLPESGDRCSIGAKGLTGQGYKGHVFWDTELFCLPFFAFNDPEAAERLLRYRWRCLPGARKKAREYGYRGAMFPWESAITGEEETPLFAALNIHTGKANPVWSGRKEHHVTADIAYAVWHDYELTGNLDFLCRCGAQILFEAAAFWVSRAVLKNGSYQILDVIGPDEYTEHVDNNAYTNYMAGECVRSALRACRVLETQSPPDYERLDRELDLRGEQVKWRDFLDRLYLPKPNRDGIIPQDDTFLQKKPLPDIERFRNSPVRQSVLLEYSRDEVVGFQVLKQADIAMLFNLFPELEPAALVQKNVRFYESRTLHDSSLSYCVYAQACAQCGDEALALSLLQRAIGVDLNENPLDSSDGIHAAALGGIWNCVVQGFAGVCVSGGKLRIRPRLPDRWTMLRFRLTCRGVRLQLEIRRGQVRITRLDGSDVPVPISCAGAETALTGTTLCLSPG